MLERGVASVEPSVQRLITQIERPVRSKKRLGDAFWYCRNDPSSVAPWWPQFLEATKVTGKPYTVSHGTPIQGQYAPHLELLFSRSIRRASSARTTPKGSRYLPRSATAHAKRDTLSQSYTTTSKQAQSAAADQIGFVDNGAITSFGKDFWNRSGHMDLDAIRSMPLAENDAVEKREDKRLSSSDASVEEAEGQPTPYQIIERYNQTPKLRRTFEQCQSVVSAALEIDDVALAKRLVRSTTVKDGFNELSKTILEQMLAKDRFKDAADIVELGQSRQAFRSSIFQKSSLSPALPAKALKLLQIISSIKPRSDDAGEYLLKRLASFLFVQIMKSQKIMSHITPEGLTTLTSAYSDAGLLEPQDLTRALPTLNAIAKRRSRPDVAILIYRLLCQRFPDIETPVHVYGSLISIITEAVTSDSWSSGTEALKFILSEFAKTHGKADRQAYQRALTACARMGDVKAVNEIYEEFEKVHGKSDNPAILNPLLYVHARIGNVSEAQKRFDWLVQTIGQTPGVTVWNTLLSAYSRVDDLSGAVEVFRRMKAAAIKPDEYTFGAIMGICARSMDSESVIYLAKEAESHGIRLTFPMMDCLVRTYCVNDELRLAEEVAESASRTTSGQYPVRMWNSILTHFAHRADTQNILRIQERMKELNIVPDDMTYAALMLSLTKIGRTRDARNILRALHFSGQTRATATHYAIVMHGFAREHRRDEVTALYQELLERVRKPNLSANLAMLKSLINRDVRRWDAEQALLVTSQAAIKSGQNQLLRARLADAKTLPHASEFLNHIIDNLDVKELASKLPRPSLGRFKFTDMIPGELFRAMILVFGSRGLFRRARALIWKYRQAREALAKTDEAMPDLPVQLASAAMQAASLEKDHTRVDKLWTQSLLWAIREGRSQKPVLQEQKPDEDKQEQSAPHNGDALLDPLKEPNLRILHPHRFTLASALNSMMYSLACRKQHGRITPLIDSVQMVGFGLDSHNWNKYVQVMALSESPQHQFIAFTTFQDRLLKNMPPWNMMTAGKALISDSRRDQINEDSEQCGEVADIKSLAFMKRGDLYPRYFTLVFLGRALLRFRERSRSDHGAELHRLLKVAKETVVTVAKMPYLRDRIQGVLLRGRDVTGDFPKLKPTVTKSNALGLLGSRSAVDNIPPENLADLLEMQRLAFNGNMDGMSVKEKEASMLQLSYSIFGDLDGNVQIPKEHDLTKTPRSRSEDHISSNETLQVEKIRELLLAMKEPFLMAKEPRGDPGFHALQVLGALNGVETSNSASATSRGHDIIRSHITPEGQKILFYDSKSHGLGPGERSYEPQIRKTQTQRAGSFDSYRYSVFDKLWLKLYRSHSTKNRSKAFSRNKRLARQRSIQRLFRRRATQSLQS